MFVQLFVNVVTSAPECSRKASGIANLAEFRNIASSSDWAGFNWQPDLALQRAPEANASCAEVDSGALSGSEGGTRRFQVFEVSRDTGQQSIQSYGIQYDGQRFCAECRLGNGGKTRPRPP